MAVIPLRDLPNAPDLASMSRPQTNDVNVPMVDLGGARAAVASSYAGAKQDPNNAGAIGGAIAGVGKQASEVANSYQKKQEELNAVVGKAQFDALNSQVMDEVTSSLDPTKPETYQGVYADKWRKVSDWYQQQPVGIQRAVYPELMRSQYGNMATVAHFAHKTEINNKKQIAESGIQDLSNQGLDQDAIKRTDEVMHSGLISVERRNEIVRTIQATKAGLAADDFILQDPAKAAGILDRASSTGDRSQLPEWAKRLDSKELGNYAKKAESVHYYREADKGMAVYDAIDKGAFTTVQQMEGSSVYKVASREWQALAKNKLLNEVVSGSPEGIKAVGDAYGLLNKFRAGKADTIAKEYHDISLIGASLPPAEGKPFMKEVDEIFRKRSENGGVLPYDQQIRTSVSAELHKTYKDGGFGDPSSEDALSAYRQAEGEWNKVTADNPHSYAEAESKFWQAQKNAAAAAALKKGPTQQKPSWFTHPIDRWNYKPTPTGTPPQASNDTGDSAGKITKYGYEKKGEKYYDSNSARGIGAEDNQLTPGESVALSPDLEKATGAKIGDKLAITIIDKDGNPQRLVKTFDDRTMQDKEAIKRFGAPLRGRVDIYSPDGKQPLNGLKVAKVERYTKDGQG